MAGALLRLLDGEHRAGSHLLDVRPDLVTLIDTVIEQTVPVTADAQPYRARSRLLAFANRLDRIVWNARAKDADPDDGAYNVLRLLDETD